MSFTPVTRGSVLTAAYWNNVVGNAYNVVTNLGYTPLNAANTAVTISGDVTGVSSFNGSNNVSVSVTLANSGVTVGTYGSATTVPVVTVDNKGRVTSVVSVAAAGVANTGGTFTGAVTFTSGTFTSTLGVAGTTTLAGMTATTGTFSSQAGFSSGITFGSQTAGSTNDLSKHIALYGGVDGINITFGSVNYVANAAGNHAMIIKGVNTLNVGQYLASFSVPVLAAGGTFTAASSFTSGTFSSTLGVSGTTTLAGMTATTGSFSGTLFSGTHTSAALISTGSVTATTGSFSGTIVTITQPTTDNSTNVATTAWVKSQAYGSGSGGVANTGGTFTGAVTFQANTTMSNANMNGVLIANLGTFTNALAMTGTLSSSDSSSNVATTAWVNSQGYTGYSSYTGYYASGFGSGYLTVNATGMAFGTGNFTVEFWIYASSNTANQYIMADDNLGTGNRFRIQFGSGSSTMQFQTPSSGQISNNAITLNAWNHIAIVRSATSTLTFYVNGVATGTLTDTSNYAGTQYSIGAIGGSGYNVSSTTYLSNLRIGTTALYTSNFTPPTVALTSTTGTVLLTLQNSTFVDNSPNHYTIGTSGTSPVMTTTTGVYFGTPSISASTVNTAFTSATFTPNSIAATGPITATTGSFSGTIVTITQPTTDNSTNVATTAWVKNQGYGSGSGGSGVAATGGTFTGAVTFQANTAMSNTSLTGALTALTVQETSTTVTISSNTLTLNLANGAVFSVAMTANVSTVTFSNPPPAGKVASFVLALSFNGTAYTITWPSSVRWGNGLAPTLSSTSGKEDLYAFLTFDGGSNYYASVIMQNS